MAPPFEGIEEYRSFHSFPLASHSPGGYLGGTLKGDAFSGANRNYISEIFPIRATKTAPPFEGIDVPTIPFLLSPSRPFPSLPSLQMGRNLNGTSKVDAACFLIGFFFVSCLGHFPNCALYPQLDHFRV